MKKILSGHVSPETAFVVADYPYGFRLRCQIRYWLEFKPGKGTRFVSQTTNPKRPGTFWNKPKASTYADVAGAMYLDDVGHVQWSGLNYYPEAAEVRAWIETYGPGCCPASLAAAEAIHARKVTYERAKATGMDYRYAGIVSTLVSVKGLSYEEALARVNVGIQKAAANIDGALHAAAAHYKSQCSDDAGAVESAA